MAWLIAAFVGRAAWLAGLEWWRAMVLVVCIGVVLGSAFRKGA